MKKNQKLKNKFFDLFYIFHVIKEQTYKLELPTKWKIYNICHIFLLKLNYIKKSQVNKNYTLPESKKEFEIRDNKKYKVKVMGDSVVYGKKAGNQLPGLYYLVL